MRRIIHNTTAIVACMSMLAPQLAQAQLVGAGSSVRPAEVQPMPEPLVLAQADDSEQAKRRAERRQQRQAEQEQNRAERAERREQRQRRQEARQERGNAERPEAPARERQAERPRDAENARNGQEEQPRPRRQNAEQREQRQQNRAERQQREERQQNRAERQQREERRQNAEQQERRERQERRQAEEAPPPRVERDSQPGNAAGDQPAAQRARSEAQQQERREERQRAERQERIERREAQEERRERIERREAQEERRERIERRETQEQRAERREERQERRQERREKLEEELAREQRERNRPARGDASTLARSNEAQRRGDAMSNLDRVLADEVDGGMRDSDLRCLSGGAPPCNGGRMVTPEGVVVERNNNGRLLLAPAAQQIFRATENGRMVPRAAEEGRLETELSRLAARERRAAANAAALREERRGRLLEERITRENSRSSNQDFATSLRDALDGNYRNDRYRNDDRYRRFDDDDDDDGNDLMKALLLGAGVLAVGSVLNNNRQVALSSPDRVVVTRPDGSQEVYKDEVALLRQPGSTVTTEEFDDGSSRTIVTRADGSKVVTIRDADLRVLRRTMVSPDGRSVRLIDDTREVEPVDIATLPEPAPVYRENTSMDEAALREALRQESDFDRSFTLGQIRNIPEVRSLVAPVNIDAITFETGSSAITSDQADQLSTLGEVIEEAIVENPQEMFLIEGHTDTVGSDAANLALSDRRAESVALALTEYFDVPPENLVVQGYGEQYPQIREDGDIRENRRASVRRITDLLQTASAEE